MNAQSPISAAVNPGIDYTRFYDENHARIIVARRLLSRALTLTDKILAAHCVNLTDQAWDRGNATLRLLVDRVALQDATAQMSLLQFMAALRSSTAIPTTIHCDHLIRAQFGAAMDLTNALGMNAEVFDFLRSGASKFGMGFWAPGSGIIHQIVLENYAFPGGLMIGTDSHTPNAGGLSMLSCGVGGADAAEAMAGLPWEVLHPKIIGVCLTGRLEGWASPKDFITYLCALLTTKGATNAVIEYFGPGTDTISATGKATICNMEAELGATGSIFPADENTGDYLVATGRGDLADLVSEFHEDLVADPEVMDNPSDFYDRIVEIDLSSLEPYVVGPHTPDRGRPIGDLGAEALENGWPLELSACLIGSCTNSSVGDMRRAAAIARQAHSAGLKLKSPLYISPGSARVYETLVREGIIGLFEEIGATILTNACGPCIGQWHRDGVPKGRGNSILSTYNRNFPGRNDGNAETLSFLSSPEIVMAAAFAGHLAFDPMNETLPLDSGDRFLFMEPEPESFPAEGLVASVAGYVPPAEDPATVEVIISPDSNRLQLLEPFAAWDGQDFIELPILLKTQGKTTTDHISPAGPWLQFRGHLDKISDNMFLGATNAFTGETGQPLAVIARRLKAHEQPWIVVGDDNYGEGSSREHAAMSPRFLGCRVVLVKSFARIHETNLKKQGILPLTFQNPDDYDLVREGDLVTISDLAGLAPHKMVPVMLHHLDGSTDQIMAEHSMNEEQIGWFRAGSALNAQAV